MKTRLGILLSLVFADAVMGGSLPVITGQPQSQNILPGNSALFSVTATNASGFQWRFNGTDIAGATVSTLQIMDAQTTNSGYYMVIAKNDTGWVPSQLAYLSLGSGGIVPLSNTGNSNAQANYQTPAGVLYGPITNGRAQVVAGPALDQMQPIAGTPPVTNGYFNGRPHIVPGVDPGQTVYYRVDISYPVPPVGYTNTQQSSVLALVAGGGTNPIPSAANLKFPTDPFWPWPELTFSSPGNQVRILGETFSLTNSFWSYIDTGIPTFQCRKDGNPIGPPTSFEYSPDDAIANAVITITNAQPADAGIYDVVVLGEDSFITPTISVSIQVTNGPGILLSPRMAGSKFVCDLTGAPGRNYAIDSSADLSTWNNLLTVSNVTGTATFTSALTLQGQFFRARLLPY